MVNSEVLIVAHSFPQFRVALFNEVAVVSTRSTALALYGGDLLTGWKELAASLEFGVTVEASDDNHPRSPATILAPLIRI